MELSNPRGQVRTTVKDRKIGVERLFSSSHSPLSRLHPSHYPSTVLSQELSLTDPDFWFLFVFRFRIGCFPHFLDQVSLQLCKEYSFIRKRSRESFVLILASLPTKLIRFSSFPPSKLTFSTSCHSRIVAHEQRRCVSRRSPLVLPLECTFVDVPHFPSNSSSPRRIPFPTRSHPILPRSQDCCKPILSA